MSRPLSGSAVTPTAVEPNTLVVAVDFGNYPSYFIGHIANYDRQEQLLLVSSPALKE